MQVLLLQCCWSASVARLPLRVAAPPVLPAALGEQRPQPVQWQCCRKAAMPQRLLHAVPLVQVLLRVARGGQALLAEAGRASRRRRSTARRCPWRHRCRTSPPSCGAASPRGWRALGEAAGGVGVAGIAGKREHAPGFSGRALDRTCAASMAVWRQRQGKRASRRPSLTRLGPLPKLGAIVRATQ